METPRPNLSAKREERADPLHCPSLRTDNFAYIIVLYNYNANYELIETNSHA